MSPSETASPFLGLLGSDDSFIIFKIMLQLMKIKLGVGSKIKIIHCQGTEAQNYFSLNRIRGVGGQEKNLACSPSIVFLSLYFLF